MTYEDYIKELERRKAKADNAFIADMGAIEDQASDFLSTWIDNTLDFKGGKFVGTDATTDLLNQFPDEYVRQLLSIPEYKGGITDYLKELNTTGELIKDFQTAQGFDISKVNIGDTQKIVVDEIIDRFTGDGLNAHFVQPLRDILYQNVVGGTRLQDAKAYLESYVKGGKDKSGKLDKYITNLARDGVDSYTAAINQKLMDKFHYNGLIISGSLIATSSPQCVLAITTFENGQFTKEEFNLLLKPIALKHGLKPGTTFETLPWNKLHEKCRHEFSGIMIKT